jgi:hypothetical protein
VTAILGSAVVAAIIAGVVAIFNGLWTEARITKLKAALDVENARRQTQFAWLHERRANAMMEIYSSILELDRTLQNLTKPGATDEWEAPSNEFEQAGRAFFKVYRPYRLLFSDAIVTHLDEIEQRTYSWRIASVFAEEPGSYVSGSSMYLVQLSESRLAIEREFRRLFGSD